MSAPPAIEFDAIGRSFGDAPGRRVSAIEDLSLSIASGEFVCVVGPSGCGKSTLLDLAGGFDRPSSGEVRVLGQPVAGPGTDRGMVFQEASLFPWLDVLGNICFGPRTRGVPASTYLPLAHRLIEQTALAGFEHHATYQLSGGMRQRVAIARAWISLPPILLMDEPFGALDAQTRLQMQELLLNVWANHRSTVLFVTHDIEEAMLLADRVCIMSARPGKVREVIEMPFDRPRDYEVLLADPRFGLIKRDITHQIREESRRMGGGTA
jgi:NitT/TauT family transport system ATP-binding protein